MLSNYSDLAQLVEHLTVNQVVAGSSPAVGVLDNLLVINFADVAQLVEHGYRKPGVGGSNPLVGIPSKHDHCYPSDHAFLSQKKPVVYQLVRRF